MIVNPQNPGNTRVSRLVPPRPKIPAGARAWILRALQISRQPALGPVQRYACGIFKLDRLGDFILAIGAIHRVTAVFGEERCVLIVSNIVESLARKLFPRIRIIALPLPPSGLLTELLPYLHRYRPLFRGFVVDRLVCLRHQRHPGDELILSCVRYQQVFAMASQPRFLAPDEALCFSINQLPLPVYPDQAPPGFCLELEAHRRIVEMAIAAPVLVDDIVPNLPIAQPPVPGRLLLCPFGSARIRHYSLESWVDVCRRLSPGVAIRVCGAPSERMELVAFCAAIQAVCQNTVEIAETADLDSLANEIANATVVAGVESAPAHLTTAMDQRGVFLIGGGHFGIFAPWSRSARQVWLFHPLPCYHCSWNCHFDQSYCISDIPPEEIARAIERLLAR